MGFSRLVHQADLPMAEIKGGARRVSRLGLSSFTSVMEFLAVPIVLR